MWLRRRKSSVPPVEAAPGPWSGLVAAVASPDPEVRRSALIRLAALDGRDPSPRVTAAAATELVRVGAPYGVELPAWSSPQVWSWRVTRARGGWDRVEADLRATADQDRTLEGLGRAGIGMWLARDAATVGEAPDDDRRHALLGLLECSPLDPGRRAALSFHIGPARPVSH